MSVPIVHILHSVSTHLEFLMKSPKAGSFHFSLPKKNVSRWLYCFLTTSPTQQGSTLPHLNWSENIYRQRLWSTHCHKVSQSFPKLIGPFVFLFSCADFELWFHLDIYIERLTFRQTKNSIIKHKQFRNLHYPSHEKHLWWFSVKGWHHDDFYWQQNNKVCIYGLGSDLGLKYCQVCVCP